MKRIAVIFFMLVPLVLIAEDTGLSKNISSQQFYEYVTKQADYTGYKMWPGYEGFKKGRKAHGDYFKLYVNDTFAEELRNNPKEAPYGSVIVKEVYGKRKKKVKKVFVMAKIKGVHPEKGDWYWATWEQGGKAYQSGTMKTCYTCHSAKKVNDYIMARSLKKDEK